MKFKVLNDFVSAIFHGVKDAVHDLDLDEHTANSWVDSGLIEEVKQKGKKKVDVAPEPVADPVPEALEPVTTPPVEDVVPDEAK